MRPLVRYDVFISHSSRDSDFVRELATSLIANGFTVAYTSWIIRPGVSWRRQLETAIQMSDAGIVVLSPDAVQSGAVDSEITLLMEKAWHNNRPLVPILYKDCEVPALLSTLQYIDFRKPDDVIRRTSMQALIRSLRGEPPSPEGNLPRARVQLRLTMRSVLLVLLAGLTLLVSGAAARSSLKARNSLKFLEGIQRSVQEIDDHINGSLLPESQRGLFTGAHHIEPIVDPGNGRRIAEDEWVDGRLEWRRFYRSERLIARDSFSYETKGVVQKRREYFNDEQQVYLIDEFTQDGMLVQKRYCPNGVEVSCAKRVVDMRSPLPPAGFVFYR